MSFKRKDSIPSKSKLSKHGGESNGDKKSEGEEESSSPWYGSKGPQSLHPSLLIHTNSTNNNTSSNSRMSPENSHGSLDNNSLDDNSSSTKDEDDDEEEDELLDERYEASLGDPEKLKAFNMFVRLFVDENLDRHIPISKQPKEKIQAIIDSCSRQFPEYAFRGRKRIRTYLKSCRRTKRTREQAGLDALNARPTPPHLTSVQAEQLLARACENESENAKRMRMGMEPIAQPLPESETHKAEFEALKYSQNGGLRPSLNHFSPPSGNTNGIENGSFKKTPLLNHKLNYTEIGAVKQLISGYKESAAFLLRSAEELEQLLSIQPKL